MDLENVAIFTDGEKQHRTSSSLTSSLLWIKKKWLKIQLTNQFIQKAKRLNCFQVKCKRQQTIFKLMMFVKLIIASFTRTSFSSVQLICSQAESLLILAKATLVVLLLVQIQLHRILLEMKSENYLTILDSHFGESPVLEKPTNQPVSPALELVRNLECTLKLRVIWIGLMQFSKAIVSMLMLKFWES